jgi:hypothetical protein
MVMEVAATARRKAGQNAGTGSETSVAKSMLIAVGSPSEKGRGVR